MRRLTEEDIISINKSLSDSWNQGIYVEPYGIKEGIKGHVIYQRHNTGGYSGGSCWDTGEDDGATPYEGEEKPKWEALDKALAIICPDLSYTKFLEIQNMVQYSHDTDYQYYGNYDDYEITILPLVDLYKHLGI